MNDEWIEDTIYWCSTFDEKEFIQVNRTELLTHIQDLRRLRELESLAFVKPEESPDDFCRCGGILKTTPDGTCFYCHGKVE